MQNAISTLIKNNFSIYDHSSFFVQTNPTNYDGFVETREIRVSLISIVPNI